MAAWVLGGIAIGLPFMVGRLEWAMLVAPVPCLLLLGASPVRALRRGYVGGFAFVATGLIWLNHVHPVAVLVAAAYFALYFAAWAACIAIVHHRLRVPLWVVAPLATLAIETCVHHVTVFHTTWLALGYALWRWTWLMQIAELGGASLVSLVIMSVACAVAACVVAVRAPGPRRLPWAPLASAAVLVALSLGYGLARESRAQRSFARVAAPTVALVQGNIPQDIRSRPESADSVVAAHLRLTLALTQPVDLVVWPESTANYALEQEPELVSLLGQAATRVGAPIALGAIGLNGEGEPPSNAVFLVDAAGAIACRSCKRVLVPGAETLLVLDHVPAIRDPIGRFLSRTMHFRPYLKAGTDAVPFPISVGRPPDTRPLTVGTLVCYDDLLPGPSDDLARKGVEALVVLSNEAWFGARELDQHMAMATVRCIETRLPMARATNTGITCVIDPLGRVRKELPRDQEGVLVATLDPRWPGRVPGRVRDIVGWSVTAIVAASVVFSLVRRRPAP